MRHKVDRRKLGLPSDQRRALLTNLARQFVRHGYVHTTLGRAKELRRIVERLVTLGKQAESVTARREARKILVGHSSSTPSPVDLAGKSSAEKLRILQERSLINGEDLVAHLFDNVAPKFKERNGGYTRLTRTGVRRGDAAPTAVLELVD
jgi:large subunit ribosomal protein L17